MNLKRFEIGLTPQADDEFRAFGREPEKPVIVEADDFIAAKQQLIDSWRPIARVRELRRTDLWVRELPHLGARDPKLSHD